MVVGDQYKRLSFIRVGTKEKYVTLKESLDVGAAEKKVKVADMRKAAGGPLFCPGALASKTFKTRLRWCHRPEEHLDGGIEHSFTHENWSACRAILPFR